MPSEKILNQKKAKVEELSEKFKKAISEIKSGKVEYRLDKTNIIHLGFGKVSFGAEKLLQNYETLLNAIVKAKPAAAKGTYLKSIAISTTMGVGIKINPRQ